MKKDYRKKWGWRREHEGDFYYSHVSGGWHRTLHTFQEIRRNEGDLLDYREERIKIRPRRLNSHLNAWNLEYAPSRCMGKTWKDFTRHRHQWEVRRDPKPKWSDYALADANKRQEPLPW